MRSKEVIQATYDTLILEIEKKQSEIETQTKLLLIEREPIHIENEYKPGKVNHINNMCKISRKLSQCYGYRKGLKTLYRRLYWCVKVGIRYEIMTPQDYYSHIDHTQQLKALQVIKNICGEDYVPTPRFFMETIFLTLAT